MLKKLAALISLAVVFDGSFALSTKSVEAKTSRDSSHRARNFLVPPPPPYIPTMIPSALGMMNAQAVTADDAVVEKEAKTSRNSSRRARNYFVPPPPPYMPTISPSALGITNAQRVTADDAGVEKPVNPYSKYIFTRIQAETRILEQIDCFDSEISSQEKEIGKLLNL